MRVMLVLAVVVSMLSGCLGKLERLTEETKDAVINSNETIKDTHKGQSLKTAIDYFTDTAKSPATRSLGAEAMIILAPEDRLFVLIGAPLPLKYPMFQPDTPNVSFVGTEVDPIKGIRPIFPGDQKILASACLSGLKFLIAQSMQANANLEDIKVKSEKAIYACTAILGARPAVGLLSDYNKKDATSWSRTQKEEDDRLEYQRVGKGLILKLIELPIFDGLFRDMVIHNLIEGKIENNFEHLIEG